MKILFKTHRSDTPGMDTVEIVYSNPANGALKDFFDTSFYIESCEYLLHKIEGIQQGMEANKSDCGEEQWNHTLLVFHKDHIELQSMAPGSDFTYEKIFIGYPEFQKLMHVILDSYDNKKNFEVNIKILRKSVFQSFPTEYSHLRYYPLEQSKELIDLRIEDFPEAEVQGGTNNVWLISNNFFPTNWTNEKILEAVKQAKNHSENIPQEKWINFDSIKEEVKHNIIPTTVWKGMGEGIEIIGSEIEHNKITYIRPIKYHGEPVLPDSENFEDLPPANN